MASPPRPPDEPPPPGDVPPDEPGPPGPEPLPPPADAGGGLCPRCGTPYEPGQEYCLECGLRIPVAHGVVGTLSTAWQRRLPWYPGDWIWPVMLGLAIAAIGATAAILATQDDDKGGPSAVETSVATGDLPTGTGTGEELPPPGTDTAPVPTVPTEEEPVEPLPPPSPPAGELVEWPPGQSGYTVVLASLPQNAGRGGALRLAREAANAGLPEAGVMDSSEFSSLHPGYYVVFSGIYSTLEEARNAVAQARSAGYPGAYSRQITP